MNAETVFIPHPDNPHGSLVDDTTSYSPPGAYEAAEEDAHRYGWELVAFNLVWK